MSASLLDQFLREECTEHVRRLLVDSFAIDAPTRTRLEFNRFEVTIDRNAEIAIIEDVLDASDAGSERIPLAQLRTLLGIQP